jgi:hypothetical protein
VSASSNMAGLTWIIFADPRDAVRWAHRAYLHAPTRALLVRIWIGHREEAGNGRYAWQIRHPGGLRYTNHAADEDEQAKAWADTCLEVIEKPHGVEFDPKQAPSPSEEV